MIPLQINPTVRDQYMRHPRIRPKIIALNIITLAFLSAPVIYMGLAYSGIVASDPGAPENDPFPIWWAITGVAFAMFPAAFMMGTILLKQVREAATFEAAWERFQVTMIVVLAFGEATAIYGLVGGFLGMPEAVRFGLMGAGMFLMVALHLLFGRSGLDLVLLRLIEEEKDAGSTRPR